MPWARWFAALALFAPLVYGQNDTGWLAGVVLDVKGQRVFQADVEVTGATGYRAQPVARGGGEFVIGPLLPGVYSVSVTAGTIHYATAEVLLHAGREAYIEIKPGAAKLSERLHEAVFGLAQLRALPNLTRDPWRSALISGNVSEAGTGTRGVGIAINGLRESSVLTLIDGTGAGDPFTGAVGRNLPLEAVQEIQILPASGGIVVASTRRGTDAFHGSLYGFNRVSRLASQSFQSNAWAKSEAAFARNQFGGVLGGSVVRHRFYFFTNAEGTVTRSHSLQGVWIPDAGFLAQTALNTQHFFTTLGKVRSDVTVGESVSLARLTALNGRSPCLGLLCAMLSTTLPLFTRVSYSAPVNSGAGVPSTAWNSFNRVDWIRSSRLRLYAVYQHYLQHDLPGTLAHSPYSDYDLQQTQHNHSAQLTGVQSWSPRWTSETSVSFDRYNIFQQGLTSRGVVPSLYANPLTPLNILGSPVAFPGYNPLSPGVGGAFGGPENVLQLRHQTSRVGGRQVISAGGSYSYIQDNRTDAAYQTAVDSLSTSTGLGGALTGLLFGTLAQVQVAVNPQGQLPCGTTPTCSLHLPLTAPDFSRSNRFHDAAFYVQERLRLSRRLSLDGGIRWEYFGVQHNSNAALDSNWYSAQVPSGDEDLIRFLVFGGFQRAQLSPVGGLYKPDRNNFAPRAGAALDVFGSGRTVIRGGYGMGFERNFGNVNFNVMRNLPNYTVLSVPGTITTDNFGPLSNSTGTLTLPPPAARIVNPALRTAWAQYWTVALSQRFSKSTLFTLRYNGSRGRDLYTVSYPNQSGFRNSKFGDFCTGNNDCRTSPNPYYSQEVGYRGNQGFSDYRSMESILEMRNVWRSGLNLRVTHALGRATDNLSSTFFEAGGNGIANRFGDRNVTANNGAFSRGFLDPYQPGLDEGAADFDVRHRVVVVGDWRVPAPRLGRGLLQGWSLAPIFLARSGQPFSVLDSLAQTLDLNTPRATLAASAPHSRNTFLAAPAPNTIRLITFQTSQFTHTRNLLTPGSAWPANMSHRNAFRAPGFWNLSLAVFRDTRLRENLTLQLRGEAYNIFNHANLYVVGRSADLGAGNTVDACFGCSGSTWDRRHIQLAARLIF